MGRAQQKRVLKFLICQYIGKWVWTQLCVCVFFCGGRDRGNIHVHSIYSIYTICTIISGIWGLGDSDTRIWTQKTLMDIMGMGMGMRASWLYFCDCVSIYFDCVLSTHMGICIGITYPIESPPLPRSCNHGNQKCDHPPHAVSAPHSANSRWRARWSSSGRSSGMWVRSVCGANAIFDLKLKHTKYISNY